MLIAFLLLSFGCIMTVIVLCLLLTMLRVGLQCVIVEFPDHTHSFFNTRNKLLTQKILKQGYWYH